MPFSNIDKPSKYFNTITWTGNGTSQSLTGVGFQPDWVWIKKRSGGTARSHQLYDVIRTATKYLHSDATDAEGTFANGLTAFNSDGFSIGDNDGVNGNTYTYVGWSWDANGAGVSNTQGSITSTVSANTTSGFSIVSYTGNGTAGATVGHGLGVAPKMIIVKNRSSAGTEWITYHASIGNGKYLALQSTAGQAGTVTIWGTSASTFTLAQAYGDYNGNGNSHVAYCFAPKAGFSSMGSYVGNGSTNGTFVYTGFKPAWVMIKNSTTAGDSWQLWDNKRLGYNVDNNPIFPNTSGAEGTSDISDILSNGFKIRTTASGFNTSGDTYIYACFAENPFVSSKGIPTTAR